MTRRVIFLALLLLGQGAAAHALGTGKPLSEYGHQGWQSDAGLPQNTVRAVLQASDGFLWIATEAGLARYDGVEFRVFASANTPALRSDLINGLTEDKAGTLWISTADGLVSERAGVFTAYGAAQGLPSANVLGTYSARDGRLLVFTPLGVAMLAGGRLHAVAGTAQLGLESEVRLAEDARGRVWVAGPERVIAIDGDQAGPALAPPAIGAISAIAATPDGALWVGGASGLERFPAGALVRFPATGTPQPATPTLTRREGLPADEVTALLTTPDGVLWIGTAKGLATLQGGQLRHEPGLTGQRIESLYADRAHSLWVATSDNIARMTRGSADYAAPPLAGVRAIFEDREGSMWFGTDSAGLHVLREQAFSTLTTANGLSADVVRAVFSGHDGTLWIGTSGGGLDRLDPNASGPVAAYAGQLPSKVVLALAETPDGALWAGTPEGLCDLRHGRVYTTADGLPDDFVRSLYADRDGSLWVGTRHGLSHLERGRFHSYTTLDGLASDLIGAILRTRAGELYVGTLAGLSRMQGQEFLNALAARGPAQGPAAAANTGAAITALLEDGTGTLWIGTSGAGLMSLRQGYLQTFASAGNLLPATIYGMVAGMVASTDAGTVSDAGDNRTGDLWLSSRTGIDHVSLAALDAYAADRATGLPVRHYGPADGMRVAEASSGGHPAATRAGDGALWFATLDGAAVIHPSATLRNPLAPLTAIERVTVDDQPAEFSPSGIRVPAGHARLSIQYAGLSFVAPQKVRYRYRLVGFDKRWIDAGARRTAFYTNVPPGSYRFLVLSANNDGVWSLAPATVDFAIEPYFYQTAWFYLLLALTATALGYSAYRWRVLSVQAQYRAVLEERGRIAREIHDTLAQGYVAIGVQLELAEHLLHSSAEAAAEQLRQSRQLVREGLAEARSSIWNLRAEGAQLPTELADHLTALTRRQGPGAAPALRFAVHGTYRPVARQVEQQVQRIAQEAVTNALAHAQATLVTVTLSYDAKRLLLRVDDDGIGIGDEPATGRRGHFGLQGMRERAARLGALLSIEASKPRGTVITLTVDLRRAARKERA